MYYLQRLFCLFLFFALIMSCNNPEREANPSGKNSKTTDTPATNGEQTEAETRISPGHIVMMTPDLDETQKFYEEHLKFHTTEDVVYDGLHRIFMSASGKHHELVLLESRTPEFPPIDQRQLQQVAFEVPTHDILVDYYQHIKQTDIPYVIKDNQVSLSLYFPDPNEVTVEVYWDITDQPFGEQMWEGRQEDISEEKFLDPFNKMEQ